MTRATKSLPAAYREQRAASGTASELALEPGAPVLLPELSLPGDAAMGRDQGRLLIAGWL